MKLGDRLKKLRNQHGYRQNDICQKLKIAQNTLSGYERSTRTPPPSTLKKLADFYGVTTDYLLGEEKNISDLEEQFPEAVQLLRRANNELTPEAKKMMVKMMKTFLDN